MRYIRYEIGSLLGFALGPIPEEDAMAGMAKKKMVPGWLRAGAFYAFLLAVGIALVVGGTVSATFALGVLRSGAPWHSVAGVVLMVARRRVRRLHGRRSRGSRRPWPPPRRWRRIRRR